MKWLDDAIYPGSFDPFTNGHFEILKQALPLFCRITLALAVNPLKTNPMFAIEDRLSFLKEIASSHSGLSVGSYPITGANALYTVDYAEEIGAKYIIRGLRNNTDFESEYTMAR